MRAPLRLSLLLAALGAAPAAAQAPDAILTLGNGYDISPNQVYGRFNGWDAKLDLYVPHDTTRAHPVLIYIHGGGWMAGTKEDSAFELLPYLAQGWAVANVEYRLAEVSLAPAAVADCRCALRWLVANAKRYHLDPARIVVTGHSAGGHLALTTGMAPDGNPFDRECPYSPEAHVAAIVNWFGITDVADLLEGANRQGYAVGWFGPMLDREPIARATSPLSMVRAGGPPVITIHGDADPTVPYQHAVRLHRALDAAGVKNQLITIPKGGHGGFSNPETIRAYRAIFEFLGRAGLTP